MDDYLQERLIAQVNNTKYKGDIINSVITQEISRIIQSNRQELENKQPKIIELEKLINEYAYILDILEIKYMNFVSKWEIEEARKYINNKYTKSFMENQIKNSKLVEKLLLKMKKQYKIVVTPNMIHQDKGYKTKRAIIIAEFKTELLKIQKSRDKKLQKLFTFV